MTRAIHVDSESGVGTYKTRDKSTRKTIKTHLHDILESSDHPMLHELSSIDHGFDHEALFAYIGVLARNRLGLSNDDEIENAFDYVCGALRTHSDYGTKPFIVKHARYLGLSTAQKTYAYMLTNGAVSI